MDKLLAPEHLFKSRLASVSPSWVRFRQTSYAVRTITRLSMRKSSGPHPSMHALVVVFLCLALFSAVQLDAEAISATFGWLMCGISLLLALFTASLTYFQRTLFKVSIALYDGSRVNVVLDDEQEAANLHDAITRAMDWHRPPGNDLSIDTMTVAAQALEKGPPLLDDIL